MIESALSSELCNATSFPKLTLTASISYATDMSSPNCMELIRGSRKVITGNARGSLTIVDLDASGSSEADMPAYSHIKIHDQHITCMKMLRRGSYLISGDRLGCFKACSLGLNNEIKEQASIVPSSAAARGLALSPGETKLVTAHDDKLLIMTDLGRGTPERSIEAHGSEVLTVDWSPSKSLIVSGGKDRILKLFDPRGGRLLHSLIYHRNSINVAKFHPRLEHLFVSSGKDQAIKIFDLRMLRELATLRGHNAEVLDVSWHPHVDTILSSCDAQGRVFLWKSPSEAPCDFGLTKDDSPILKTVFLADGASLASVSNDRIIRLWNIDW